LAYLPNKTLQRLVDRMPEAFLDGEIFNQPYTTLTGTPQTSMERLKEDSKSLIVNYLNDLVQLLDGNSRQRSELLRAASTLELLDQRLAV